MGSFSLWHWIVVLIIVLLLFGAGKIPRLMGDLAKGVKAFKSGMREDDEPVGDAKKSISSEASPAAVPENKDQSVKN
ncbi:MAG: twin-arginine translocase TatA/TatE family subunit [Alphaproteobacteria bacterium]|nr:twin-arginine translocase TatA/TatE family subunit [Alphaproteobacteria bacterium]